MANNTNPLAAPQYPQDLITCRACGMKHQSIVNCPACKKVTPHYAVLKGGAK